MAAGRVRAFVGQRRQPVVKVDQEEARSVSFCRGVRGCVRNLVETALGVVLVAGLVLAVLLLPCALIDMAAGTSLLGPLAAALLLALSAAAVLGVTARRYSNDESGRRSFDKNGTAGNKGNADSDYEKGWRRR
jgi:hypothetical protein